MEEKIIREFFEDISKSIVAELGYSKNLTEMYEEVKDLLENNPTLVSVYLKNKLYEY